jgi:hypothetical protein
MNKLPGFGLVERARALAPLIAREADEIERSRRLTQPVVSALIENGLYRALMPQSFGGAEAPPEIFMQMLEEIAKADASTAWCLGQCSVCAMTAAYLDPEAAREIFAAPTDILAWGAIAIEVQVVPGDQRHDVRRLGRDRPQRHRHRLLFGRQSFHSREIRSTPRRSLGTA